MGSKSNQDRLFPCAQSLIRRKARSLIGAGGFTSSDLDDIKQDLMIDVLCRADRFDPARGSEIQFVSTVVRHRIARIVERKKAKKRGDGITFISLDEVPESQDGEESCLHDTVDKETYLGLTRGPEDPLIDRLEAQIDLGRIKRGLLPDQCELLTLLLTHTHSEAAQVLGVPRTTLSSRVSKLLSHLRKTKSWG
jgi:RNA polymerase sigma-70 factor (ECF subfamily)